MNFKIIPISGTSIPEESKKPTSPNDAEILRKCLKENKGDKTKCKSKVEAFKSAVASSPTIIPSSRILRAGSITDV
ncbi:hypothetical protein RND81_03G210800 [Saponaria officinalis]|uniref:Uncharacterized protein n=1 Tax=Saponaria officinalis TaxID=3572 RepID=A0AAW1MAX1_SAPOF